jgi:GNAT superfamily N-acetyltransferase
MSLNCSTNIRITSIRRSSAFFVEINSCTTIRLFNLKGKVNLIIRLAQIKDIDQLIKRWDFTVEEDFNGTIKESEYRNFQKECEYFLLNAINSNHWFIWVAEINGEIVSHIYIELIQKVPRPGRITYPFAYMTNVFTVEQYRGKGIGGKLITEINKWVNEMNYEFIIVWPSDDRINFYKRNGYKHCNQPMEYVPTF